MAYHLDLLDYHEFVPYVWCEAKGKDVPGFNHGQENPFDPRYVWDEANCNWVFDHNSLYQITVADGYEISPGAAGILLFYDHKNNQLTSVAGGIGIAATIETPQEDIPVYRPTSATLNIIQVGTESGTVTINIKDTEGNIIGTKTSGPGYVKVDLSYVSTTPGVAESGYIYDVAGQSNGLQSQQDPTTGDIVVVWFTTGNTVYSGVKRSGETSWTVTVAHANAQLLGGGTASGGEPGFIYQNKPCFPIYDVSDSEIKFLQWNGTDFDTIDSGITGVYIAKGFAQEINGEIWISYVTYSSPDYSYYIVKLGDTPVEYYTHSDAGSWTPVGVGKKGSNFHLFMERWNGSAYVLKYWYGSGASWNGPVLPDEWLEFTWGWEGGGAITIGNGTELYYATTVKVGSSRFLGFWTVDGASSTRYDVTTQPLTAFDFSQIQKNPSETQLILSFTAPGNDYGIITWNVATNTKIYEFEDSSPFHKSSYAAGLIDKDNNEIFWLAYDDGSSFKKYFRKYVAYITLDVGSVEISTDDEIWIEEIIWEGDNLQAANKKAVHSLTTEEPFLIPWLMVD